MEKSYFSLVMERSSDKIYQVEKISKNYYVVFESKICSKSTPRKFENPPGGCVCMKMGVST